MEKETFMKEMAERENARLMNHWEEELAACRSDEHFDAVLAEMPGTDIMDVPYMEED